MKNTMILAAAMILPGAAHAAQFQAPADLQGGVATPYGQIAAGPANGTFGASADGGFDAFDNYGYFTSDAPGGLTVLRQAEFFADKNLYRWYDSFTNATGSTITTTVRFSGDLGSDSGTSVRLNESGLLVTCQGAVCSSDPVVAAVFSNNGSGATSLTPGSHSSNDRYNADFTLTVLPGQTVSLVNFAFVARDVNGTTAADETLAIDTARALKLNPYFDGLTAAQRASIVNFNVDATPGVPEPATWAMMIGGFGVAGIAARRRRRRVALSA